MTTTGLQQRLASNLRRIDSLIRLAGDSLVLRLPLADSEHLAMLTFAVGNKTKESINACELAQHRGKSIDELLRERIDAYLNRSTFNTIGDLLLALRRMALDPAILDPHKVDHSNMMQRRHLIVHRADRDEGALGSAHTRTRPIPMTSVSTWKAAVEGFSGRILATLRLS